MFFVRINDKIKREIEKEKNSLFYLREDKPLLTSHRLLIKACFDIDYDVTQTKEQSCVWTRTDFPVGMLIVLFTVLFFNPRIPTFTWIYQVTLVRSTGPSFHSLVTEFNPSDGRWKWLICGKLE
jgi:hypothetical protein